ncbi:MAG: hypothetical protein R3Y21_04750 [Mycoplasmatota bacterium]
MAKEYYGKMTKEEGFFYHTLMQNSVEGCFYSNPKINEEGNYVNKLDEIILLAKNIATRQGQMIENQIIDDILRESLNRMYYLRNSRINAEDFEWRDEWVWVAAGFPRMVVGLNNLIEDIKLINNENGSVFISEELISLIETLRNQVQEDLEYFKEFCNKKWNSRNEYKVLKEDFESKNIFGKLLYVIDGESTKLAEARSKSIDYNTDYDPLIQHNLKIVNPPAYDKHLKLKRQKNKVKKI